MISTPVQLKFGGSTVLVDARGIRLTDRIGAEMLALRERSASRATIARSLAARYDVSERRARRDVDRFFAGFDGTPELILGSVGPKPRAVSGPDPDDDALAHRTIVSLPPYRVTVSAESPELLQRFERLAWPDEPESGDTPLALGLHRRGTLFPISIEGRWVDRGDTPAEAAFLALRHAAASLAERSSFTALLHAGALVRNGRAILLAGSSGVGKSTLVAGCVAEGWQCVNDDTVTLRVFDRSADVSSCALPIGVKAGSFATLRALYPVLDDLEPEPGGVPPRLLRLPREALCTKPVRCGLLVLPRFDTSATGATVERVTPETALVELCEAGAFLGDPPSVERLRALLGWLETLPVWRLIYPSLDEARAGLERLSPSE